MHNPYEGIAPDDHEQEIKKIKKENKLWDIRYHQVLKLIHFVKNNLNPERFGASTGTKRELKMSNKAASYVYLHFIAGRLSNKTDDTHDPLFCVSKTDFRVLDQTDDVLLMHNLLPGKYDEFLVEEQKAYDHVRDPDVLAKWGDVTWEKINANYNINHKSKQILQKLQDELHRKYDVNTVLHPSQVGKGMEIVVQKMISLTLRYLCVGGFSDPIHSSIPASYTKFLKGCVECFASPLNHKLDTWYSFFQADKDFGSLGNFFQVCAENGEKLPPHKAIFGSALHLNAYFEMNPCWCNAIYEHLAKILRNSMDMGVRSIVLGPNWEDEAGDTKYAGEENKWSKELDTICESGKVHKTSVMGKNTIEFVLDALGRTHKQETRYWVISDKDVPVDIIQGLETRIHDHPDFDTMSQRSTVKHGGRELHRVNTITKEEHDRYTEEWLKTEQGQIDQQLLRDFFKGS